MTIDLAQSLIRNEITQEDVLILSAANTGVLWPVIEKLLSEAKRSEYNTVMKSGKVSDSDFTQDFRYRLGALSAIEKVLALPHDAKKLCERGLSGGNQHRM